MYSSMSGAPQHPDTPSPATTCSPGSLAPKSKRRHDSKALDEPENRRKAPKVSRACDQCKSKKTRCSGTIPCETCLHKAMDCTWDASYSRGGPRYPRPAPSSLPGLGTQQPLQQSAPTSLDRHTHNQAVVNSTELSDYDASQQPLVPPSRGSPELESAEIRGQYYDLTSGLTFVHRARRRLSTHSKVVPDVANGGEKNLKQRLMCAGDLPFPSNTPLPSPLPSSNEARQLLEFYFDSCVVTYRFLHQQSIERWLEILLENVSSGKPLVSQIGHARASVVLTIFAIVSYRKEKIQSGIQTTLSSQICISDGFFLTAANLTEEETGLPRLESAQARLLQVLYLLQTFRMNQAWYVFGHTRQIISALGLHRKPHRIWSASRQTPSKDYIHGECRKRTFWTAYTIDKYLCVVLGRPTHYFDNDIDQEFPQRIDDLDMSPDGPTNLQGIHEYHVDALIAHAQVSRIIGDISRDVYSIQHIPRSKQIAAAQHHCKRLHEWRATLPPHLGNIRPSSLIPSYRRQSLALKLAYSHAIMHANRPFLLGDVSGYFDECPSPLKESIGECLSAAHQSLEIFSGIASDGVLLHSLWWMFYVTFCALSVVYVWEIQQNTYRSTQRDTKLFALAERCHSYLAQATPVNSPTHTYSVILEELCMEAKYRTSRQTTNVLVPSRTEMTTEDGIILDQSADLSTVSDQLSISQHNLPMANPSIPAHFPANAQFLPNPFDEWGTLDWLDFDSSAFLPFLDVEASPEMYNVL